MDLNGKTHDSFYMWGKELCPASAHGPGDYACIQTPGLTYPLHSESCDPGRYFQMLQCLADAQRFILDRLPRGVLAAADLPKKLKGPWCGAKASIGPLNLSAHLFTFYSKWNDGMKHRNVFAKFKDIHWLAKSRCLVKCAPSMQRYLDHSRPTSPVGWLQAQVAKLAVG